MDRGSLRIGLAQLNPTVGALDENARALVDAADRAAAGGAHVFVAPELSLVGYPPRDLLDRPSFLDDVAIALKAVAAALPPELTCFIGAPVRTSSPVGPALHNAVAVARAGRVEALCTKRLLPCYDVFDEPRWFAPGEPPALVDVHGVRLGVTVCEDVWNTAPTSLASRRYETDPVRDVVARGADVVVNVAASPFTRGKWRGRGAMLADVARSVGRPIVFVNQAGAHDDLIFDGGSAIFDEDGRERVRLADFAEDERVVALDAASDVGPRGDEDEAVLAALVLGVRDFARRTGLSRAVVGLSGGLDSALVAAIAARALGGGAVVGVSMPSRFSSQHSRDDAEALARALGCRYSVVSIEDMFEAASSTLTPALAELGPQGASDVTFENAQARLRCLTLMAFANRAGGLLLNTGNKSEIACGYCTLYGDMAGGLSVLGDVFKTEAYRLARIVNAQDGRPTIPLSTLEKPPSAELRPDQKDTDSLPPYEVLDPLLRAHVEGGRDARALVAEGFDTALVARVVAMVRAAEHKRRQLPPALIVTGKAFAVGRRMPIAARFRP